MTLVSEIITDAFRQSNLVAVGVEPTDAEKTEALRYLNRLLKSVFGNEAGDPLTAFPIGRQNIQRPAGFPWYGEVPSEDWFVPLNVRVMMNLDKSVPLYLHPLPNNGARFAAIDVTGALSQNPVTIYGNGRLIEGQQSITLDEDSLDAEWFYRDDLANWIRYSPLAEGDIFPFPAEFDDYFITMLAIRLNPSYGIALDPQSAEIMRRSKTQLQARYTQKIPMKSEVGLLRLSRMAADRDQWRDYDSWPYDPTTMFNVGRPY